MINKHIKILHLEDNPSDAMLIGKAIKRQFPESEILVVDSRAQYIGALHEFPADIILADHSLPSFNSHEALKIFQEHGIKIPFILVTAAMSDEFAVDILKRGAEDYILKDRLQRLPNAIHSALEKFELQKEKENYVSELENKERKYRTLVESGADVVVILDAEFKPIYASPTIRKILGYTEEETFLLDISNIVHPEDREAVMGAMAESLANPGIPVKNHEGRVLHKDGTWRWMEATVTNMLHDPAINGIVDNFRDITDRKISDQAIKESEEKYRAFFGNSLDGILLTTTSGVILAANPAACAMLGMTEAEVCNVGRAGIIDTADPKLAAALKELQIYGQFKAEVTFVRKNGTTFPIELSASIIKEEEELTTFTFRDINDRKRAEEELTRSEEQYRLLFRSSPLPMWIYDLTTFRILDVNEVAVTLYGYSRKEFLQMTIMDLKPSEEVQATIDLLQKILDLNEKEITWNGESNHIKKDKTLIKAEVRGYTLTFQNTKSAMVVAIDITDREATLQKLKDREQKLLIATNIAQLGYWEVNLEDQTLIWSDQAYFVWGQDKETFVPIIEALVQIVQPHDREAFLQNHVTTLKELKDYNFEFRIVLHDGTIKWIHRQGQLVKNEQEVPTHFEGTVQDVTERRKETEKLELSEARTKGILKSQTNYIIRTDLEGNYSYCNDKFKQDYGWFYPNEEVIGKPSFSTIMDYHHQRTMDTVTVCLAQPTQVCQVELDKPKQDGGVRTTLWDFVSLTDNKNKPFEIQCVGIDITDRVKAEKALKESNTRYELVSKATSDAIWDWDLKSGNIYWSDAYSSLFGYDHKCTFPTLDFWAQHLHPEDKTPVENSLEDALTSTETNWKAEYRYLKANGDYATVIDRGFIIRDDENVAIRMVGAMHDITEFNKLKELLHNASQLARIGSFEADIATNTLYWSEVTKEIHEVESDYEPDIETAFAFYTEKSDQDLLKKSLKKAIEENIPFDLEMQITTARGKLKWVRTIGKAEFIKGKCKRFYGSFQDIDNVKKAEQQVLQVFKERNTILESIGDAFFALDKNWVVTYWNKQAEKLLYLPKRNILGKNFWDIFHDALETPFFHYYHKAVTENTTQQFEAFYKGTNSWYEVNAYPSPSGLSVYFKDITERKLSDLRLRELNENLEAYTKELVISNKELEQFSYIVSHNLRAPVSNILGLAGLIQHCNPSFEENKVILDGLITSSKRLDEIIRDLNMILQVKNNITERRETVALSQVLKEVQLNMEHLISKEGVQIIADFDEQNELVTLKSYLHSIFYNLILNGIKYRRPDLEPVIQIKSQKVNNDVMISFKDNGCGIDLDKVGDKLFGLYRRFHLNIEGKGMGLFMVKTQVEILEGKIHVESAINEGTTFSILFRQAIE